MKKKNKKTANDSSVHTAEPELEGTAQTESAPNAPNAPDATTPDPETDWKDRFLRAKADFANLQRRSDEERRQAVRYANADFARSLLEVLDDFERTMQAGNEGGGEQLLTGINLVYDKMLKAFSDHNVLPIEADGQPFDPQRHEALMQQPSADHEPNTVVQQVQKGYSLFDRVLRPARVIVSKAVDAEATTED